MHVQLFLSDKAVETILRLRLLSRFQPIDEPLPYENPVSGEKVPCFMDGFHIQSVPLSSSPRSQNFVLNTLNATQSEVVPTSRSFGMNPVMGSPGGYIEISPVSAVEAARVAVSSSGPGGTDAYPLPERHDALPPPLLGTEFDMFFTVSPQGVPTLNVSLEALPLVAAQLQGAQAFLGRFGGLSVPIPIGDEFARILAPGRTRVLNAGIRKLETSIVMRFEFETEPADALSEVARQQEWQNFFQGTVASPLGDAAWAFDCPTIEMRRALARVVDEEFEDEELKTYFVPTGPASVTYSPGGPGFAISKEGTAQSVCGGLNVQAAFEAEMILKIDEADTLRIDATVDVNLDDADSAKCIIMVAANPLAGIIAAFDSVAPPWAAFLLTVGAPLAIPVLIVFGLLDDLLIKHAITKAQEKAKPTEPKIVRTSSTTLYMKLKQQIVTDLTRDWLVARWVRGMGDRLILGGDFNAPAIALPRLRGTLTDGFDFWSKKDRCSTNPKYYTSATISLAAEDAASQSPVPHPIIPMQYGIDIDTMDGSPVQVGDVSWRIVGDDQGIYRGAGTRLHWAGRPGVIEIELNEPADPFASAPYPFRIQIFTNYGVREFEIPAPPPLPKRPTTQQEVIFEQAERISQCYIFSSLIHLVKALQVHWLPTPVPGLEAAQYWQVLVRGIGREDRLKAWNADTGDLLAEVRPYNIDLTEISLVMPPETPMRTLQLTLNDAPLLREDDYLAAARGIERREEDGPNPVHVRQTPLYLVARLELPERAVAVSASAHSGALRIRVDSEAASRLMEFDPSHPSRGLKLIGRGGPGQVVPRSPSSLHKVRQSSREGRQEIEIMRTGSRSEKSLVARYFSRPMYDRGWPTGGHFVQLSDDGLTVNIYGRGVTHHVAPDIGASHGR